MILLFWLGFYVGPDLISVPKSIRFVSTVKLVGHINQFWAHFGCKHDFQNWQKDHQKFKCRIFLPLAFYTISCIFFPGWSLRFHSCLERVFSFPCHPGYEVNTSQQWSIGGRKIILKNLKLCAKLALMYLTKHMWHLFLV